MYRMIHSIASDVNLGGGGGGRGGRPECGSGDSIMQLNISIC